MNDQLSWDQALVKKYSSSNHYKLLTQLRNEVKKYPLKKKKEISTERVMNSPETRNSHTKASSTELPLTNISNVNKDQNNKSTVSFNNSKNFSIYKNSINEAVNDQSDQLLNINERNEVISPTNFKERLNEIEMK